MEALLHLGSVHRHWPIEPGGAQYFTCLPAAFFAGCCCSLRRWHTIMLILPLAAAQRREDG
jgi:hypothetical protein